MVLYEDRNLTTIFFSTYRRVFFMAVLFNEPRGGKSLHGDFVFVLMTPTLWLVGVAPEEVAADQMVVVVELVVAQFFRLV